MKLTINLLWISNATAQPALAGNWNQQPSDEKGHARHLPIASTARFDKKST
jgi:hypothetical protein